MKKTRKFLPIVLISAGISCVFADSPPMEDVTENAPPLPEKVSYPKIVVGSGKSTDDLQSRPQETEKRVIWSSLPLSQGDREDRPQIGADQGWVRVGSIPSLKRGYGNLTLQKDHRGTGIKGGRSASHVIRVPSHRKKLEKGGEVLLHPVSLEHMGVSEGSTATESSIDTAYKKDLEKKLKTLKEKEKKGSNSPSSR